MITVQRAVIYDLLIPTLSFLLYKLLYKVHIRRLKVTDYCRLLLVREIFVRCGNALILRIWCFRLGSDFSLKIRSLVTKWKRSVLRHHAVLKRSVLAILLAFLFVLVAGYATVRIQLNYITIVEIPKINPLGVSALGDHWELFDFLAQFLSLLYHGLVIYDWGFWVGIQDACDIRLKLILDWILLIDPFFFFLRMQISAYALFATWGNLLGLRLWFDDLFEHHICPLFGLGILYADIRLREIEMHAATLAQSVLLDSSSWQGKLCEIYKVYAAWLWHDVWVSIYWFWHMPQLPHIPLSPRFLVFLRYGGESQLRDFWVFLNQDFGLFLGFQDIGEHFSHGFYLGIRACCAQISLF